MCKLIVAANAVWKRLTDILVLESSIALCVAEKKPLGAECGSPTLSDSGPPGQAAGLWDRVHHPAAD